MTKIVPTAREATVGHIDGCNIICEEFSGKDLAATPAVALAQVYALKAIATALIYIGDQLGNPVAPPVPPPTGPRSYSPLRYPPRP